MNNNRVGGGIMRSNKMSWLALVLSVTLIVCGGCRAEKLDGDDSITLRVLSNAGISVSSAYGMDYEIKRLIGEYEATHENVTIELEFLPASGEERETRIEQLRTEIMAGNGTDIYLMSPYKLEQVGYNSYQTELDKGLFPNVEQSMHNGLFYDVSTLYDADGELNIQELATSVMNAGVIDEARYMLPLRYTYPVICADKEALEKSGTDVEAMKSDLNGYFGELLEHGDASWFNGASQLVITMDPFYLFPKLIDYESGNVLLTAEELVEFTRQCWELTDRCERILSVPGASTYVQMGWFPLSYPDLEDGEVDLWESMRAPLCMGGLSTAVSAAAIARAEGVELEMFPLRSADGSLVAEITWWGAVGAGCEHPETAYDFLRLMLLPETQWELERPTGGGTTAVSGLFGSGWPVRVAGSVEPLWNELKAQLGNSGTGDKQITARRQALQSIALTDDDILPLLTAQVDAARVPMVEGSEWSSVLTNRSEYEENVDVLARGLIDSLRWHVTEG